MEYQETFVITKLHGMQTFLWSYHDQRFVPSVAMICVKTWVDLIYISVIYITFFDSNVSTTTALFFVKVI